MKSYYRKPVVSVRPVWGGQSLLAGSDITITKSNETYSGTFHAKRFMPWDDDEGSNAKGTPQ